ncbi:DUF11 domain-containing protein [Adhaeretor mobilis]|uniref:Large cysteine-rich periplasmic protein OmcB n=1 Tax=Adhaeretor mobilis TaxID=1930276 RepID=A0A517MPG9_9BACT|nr:DUF11 domain-containing protein [Adhaeretor mobilis]QDS96783.1 Large cysteine-rich periplasmic protein OmcB precursor [Adhaeretor mobilis]
MDDKTLGSHTLNQLTLGPQRRWARDTARRVAPWALSLGLFGAGGWSVYQMALPVADSDSEQASVDSSVRSEQIEQLFGSSAPAQNVPPANDSYSQNNYTDRYTAPPLPPAVEVPELAEVETKAETTAQSEDDAANPQAAIDRYSAHTATPETVEEQEVTRGQNPEEGNPLRGSQQIDLVSAEESRAAFRDDHVEQPLPAKPLPVAARPRDMNNALPPAQPLADSRYGGGESGPISVGATPTLADAPTPDFRSTGSTQPATQAPTPAPPMPVSQEQPSYLASQTPQNGLSDNDLRETQTLDDSSYDHTPSSNYGSAAQPTAQASTLPSSPLSAVTPTPGINSTPGTGRPGERVLEGAQSPSIAIQKLAPPEIQVGKKCTFAIRVKNIGQRAAQGVVILDEVPLGTQLVGTSPRANVASSQVKWDLGTLSVGEERIVEMELMPTDEGELGSVATVTFAAQASAKSRSTRPELALRMSTKPRVMAGDRHLVQIEVSNPGTGDATGVMLLETLPQGVSHEAGTALEFEIGTLRAGESRKLDLVLNAEQAGVIENIMTARADANLEVTSSCEFEIIAPDLKLTVDGPKRKYLERPATFVVNIDNPGTAAAKDVQLVTQLPKGLQFVSANNLGEYDSATHSVYWNLPELPANERGSVEVTALPVEAGAHTVKAATRSEQGLEDRAESQLQVEGLAALKFVVVDLEDPIEIGGETSYEIRVMNQGSKAAANVQIVATLPEGMRAIDARGETRHSIQGNRVVFSPLAQLTPKAESVYRIQVQGVRPGDQRVKVQITTDEIQNPITKEESTRVYADQ